MKPKRLFYAILLLTITAFCGKSQTVFQYPVAPDTCTTLESRCDYIIQRFWDNCDLSKTFTNDSAYLVTMTDYFEIMKNANRQVGLASIRDLMFKAQSNHTNFSKLMQYAEFLLFMRPTDMIDDVYLAFAASAAEASWVEKEVKTYYKDQIARINTCKMGEPMANFVMNDTKGKKTHLYDIPLDSAQAQILVFTNNDTDGDIAKLRLSTDLNLNRYVGAGVVKLITIDVSGKADIKADEAKYPTWTATACKDAIDKIDIRRMPAVFILDADHKVMRKNLSIDELINMFN
ncbi:MAG: DUF5106 domain-containing protein [Muribaculaceae bacterium]|nr:DUF5106 domain-containing protein [Muribaculaceae bacterium]